MDICVHVLSVMNSATMNICVLVFARTSVFNSPECVPRSGVAGSHGDSMFNLLKNGPLSTFESVRDPGDPHRELMREAAQTRRRRLGRGMRQPSHAGNK